MSPDLQSSPSKPPWSGAATKSWTEISGCGATAPAARAPARVLCRSALVTAAVSALLALGSVALWWAW